MRKEVCKKGSTEKMKSNLKYIVMISSLLLFGLISLIVFLTVPEDRLNFSVFWLAFSFSVPFNFVSLIAFQAWGFSKADKELARLPMVLYVSGAFTLIYLAVGALFMYLPIEDITFPLILFISITVIYFIASAFSVYGANYITAGEKAVKEKRIFIKLLEGDVLDCAEKADGYDSKELLKKLADEIHYSDPMSHPSLAGIESEMSALIGNISLVLSENPSADIAASVAKAQALLKSRNNRCIMLK